MIALCAALLVQLVERHQLFERPVVTNSQATHKLDAFGKLRPHGLVERGSGVRQDGLLDLRGEILVVSAAPAKAHEEKARRQQAPLARPYTAGMSFLRARFP